MVLGCELSERVITDVCNSTANAFTYCCMAVSVYGVQACASTWFMRFMADRLAANGGVFLNGVGLYRGKICLARSYSS